MRFVVFMFLPVVILFWFQNCGPGMTAKKTSSSSLSSENPFEGLVGQNVPYVRTLATPAIDDRFYGVETILNKTYVAGTSRTANSANNQGILSIFESSGVSEKTFVFGNDDQFDQLNTVSHHQLSLAYLGGFRRARNFSSSTDHNDGVIVKLDTTTSTIRWAKFYGSNLHEIINSVIPDNQGVFLVGSHVTNGSTPRHMGWVARIDHSGQVIWSQTLAATTTTSQVEFRHGFKSSDGYLYVVGRSQNRGGGSFGDDAFIAKFNSNGSLLWSHAFSSADGNRNELFNSGLELQSGNILAVGHLKNNMFATLMSPDGNVQKHVFIPGLKKDFLASVKQSPAGEVLFAGSSQSYGNNAGNDKFDGFVLKTNDTLNSIHWAKSFSGNHNLQFESGSSVDIGLDGNTYLVGFQQSSGAASSDAHIYRVSENGSTSCSSAKNETPLIFTTTLDQISGGHTLTDLTISVVDASPDYFEEIIPTFEELCK